ncbi:hypothetical protein AB0923_22810 [Streptomyces virginiae]
MTTFLPSQAEFIDKGDYTTDVQSLAFTKAAWTTSCASVSTTLPNSSTAKWKRAMVPTASPG